MFYRRLPIARITVLTIGIFFTAATIVFAQHTTKPEPKKTIAIHTTPHIKPTKKPTQTTKKMVKARPSVTPTPTTAIKALGGVTTPTPTTNSPTSSSSLSKVEGPTNPTSPILSVSPTLVPTAIPATGSLLDQVNAYRASQGLGPVQSSGETCAFAATRAQEIASNFSHDGFNTRVANRTLPYSSWSNVTENIAQTSNPQNVVQMWINSPGHAANMRADTPFVCIQQNGSFYAYEGMKP